MRKLIGAAALTGLLLAPSGAEAQLMLGPMAAFHDDFDFGIGAYLDIPVPSLASGLSITPSFFYYFPDDPLDFWELNGDVTYRFAVSDDTPVLPYVMAGLNIATLGNDISDTSDSEIGLNLGGGVVFRAASLEPFVGAKFEIQDGSAFVLYGGVGFPIG